MSQRGPATPVKTPRKVEAGKPPKKPREPDKVEELKIPPPQFKIIVFDVTGPDYLQNRFSQKAQEQIRTKQAAGDQAGSKKGHKPKEFEALFKGSMYRDAKGRYGIPCSAFRQAMISACAIVQFKMTLAKKGLFVLADTYDALSGRPLVLLDAKPVKSEMMAKPRGRQPDIRVRAMFYDWKAKIRVRFDEGMFSASDVCNLMIRAGMQIGVGEGRHDSKDSAGMGLGCFDVKVAKESRRR